MEKKNSEPIEEVKVETPTEATTQAPAEKPTEKPTEKVKESPTVPPTEAPMIVRCDSRTDLPKFHAIARNTREHDRAVKESNMR